MGGYNVCESVRVHALALADNNAHIKQTFYPTNDMRLHYHIRSSY
jgi:hypothetical protein